MNCCPTRDRFELFLAERLDDQLREELEQHVESCSTCQQVLDALTKVADWGSLRQPATARGATAEAGRFLHRLRQSPPLSDEPASRLSPAIAGYEILGELGRGGMGVVYQARQVQLNRPCALKMILAGAHANPDAVARFLAEAQAIARLQHPHIVLIHHIGEADGLPFFELEYLPGGGLDRQLDGAPWQPGRAALLVEQLARAMVEAHRLGVVHRDLKPANVLLAADGTPKITDFGLAKMLDSESALTRTELVMGSPSYMAPEQAGGQSRQTGPAADIYALGAVLYELLTGRPPFRGATAMETLDQVKGSEPVPPSRLVPKLARDIETICLRCLHKEPTRRYQNASALSEDLRRFRAGEPIVARRVGRSERMWKWARRRPAIAALSGLIVLVAALGLIGMSVLYGQAVVARSIAVAQTTKALDALQSSEASLYTNRIALADRYRQTHDADRADELLDDCPVSLRDWEWRYLKRRHFEDVTVYEGVRAASLALSADGRYLVSVGFDHGIHVRDRTSGRVRELQATSDGHEALALSPDGLWMAVGGDNGTFGIGVVGLWSTKTWTEVKTLPFVGSNPHALAFSPDSRRLVAGHDDDMVRVWDIATGTLRSLSGHTRMVMDVSFSPDGRLIASASQDTTIRIWDAETLEPQAMLRHQRPVFGLAFHPRARLLASSTGDDFDSSRGDLTLWNVDSAQMVRKTSGLAAMVRKVCFSPDGGRLATTGWDRVVRIWDATTLHELLSLTGHSGLFRCLTFSQDGNQLVSGGDDGIRCWNAAPLPERPQHRPLRSFSDHEQPIFALALTSDGRHLVFAGADHTARVLDVATGRQLFAYRKHRCPITALAVRPDGQAVASGGYRWPPASGVDNLFIRIWDARTGADLVQLRGPEPGVSALAFHPDGVRLASASWDGTVRLWDTHTREQLHEFPSLPGWVYAIAFTPDGNRIAAAGEDGAIHLWDVATRQLLHVLRGHTQRVVALAFHPDCLQLASASLDGTVRIWLSLVPFEDRHLDGFRGRALAWSPNGQYLAMSGAGGSLKVWERSSGRRVLTLQGHTDDITTAAYTPDGRRLITAGWDRTVKLWDTVLDNPDLWAGESQRLVGHHAPVSAIAAVLPDGKSVISGGDDRTIRLRDIASGHELRRWVGSDGKILSLAATPDGTRVVVAGEDSDLRLWDIESGRELHRLKGHGGANFALAITPDGRHLISGCGFVFDGGWKSGRDLDLHLWDIETGREIPRTFSGHKGGIWSVVVSPDGRRAASASIDGTARVWDIDTGDEVQCFDGHHAEGTGVAFLPDGERLLSVGIDRHLRLWDIATGREVRRFDGLRGDVACVAISPDGRRALSGEIVDHHLRLWDIATGRELYHYEVPHAWLTRGTFTRDGRQAIWAGFDGTLRVWDLPEQFTSGPGTR